MTAAAGPLFTLLCEALLLSLALLPLAIGASVAISGRSAAQRCMLWQAASLAVLLLPLVSLLSPGTGISLLPSRAARIVPAPPPAVLVQTEPPVVRNGYYAPPAAHHAVGTVVEAYTPSPSLTAHAVQRRLPLYAGLLWAAVMLALLLAEAASLRRLAMLKSACKKPDEEALADAARRIAVRLSLRRIPTILTGPVVAPMAWGCRRPVIVLPANAGKWSTDRLDMALLHESAHVLRCDWLSQQLARLVSSVCWFSPLAWISLSRMKRAAEQACDDVVLSNGVPAPEYAALLLEVVMQMKQSSRLKSLNASVSMARPIGVTERVYAILQPGRSRAGIRKTTLVSGLLIVAAVSPLSMLHVFAQSAAAGSRNAAAQSSGAGSSAASTKDSRSGMSHQNSASARRLAQKVKNQAEPIHRLSAQLAEQRMQIDEMRKQLRAMQTQSASAQIALQADRRERTALAIRDIARLPAMQAQVDYDKAELDRMKLLESQGSASRSEVDSSKEKLLQAEEEMQKLRELVPGPGREDAARAEARMAQAKKELEAAMMERDMALQAQGALSQADLAQQEARLAAAEAELQALRERSAKDQEAKRTTPKSNR